MFRSYFNQDAFTCPPPRTTTPKNYQLLYPNQNPINSYLDGTEPEQEAFEQQYENLMNAFKVWGKTNKCGENLDHQIDIHKSLIFDESYSGNQPSAFFDNIKLNLENIWFILTEDENVAIIKKQKEFKNLFSSIHVCAPGLYTHIEDTLHRLQSELSVEYWLTEFRTNIIRLYSETHIRKKNILDGNSIHVYNAFLIYALNEGWGPLSKANQIIDPFAIAHSQITEEDLFIFANYFAEQYSPEAILHCITTNFIFEFNQIKKTLSITDEGSGWVPATPELLKEATSLANLIGIEKNNFFDLSDDYEKMRFNAHLFISLFLKYCLTENKIFNPALWQIFSFANGYTFYNFSGTNLAWFENPHDEIVEWDKLQDEFDPKLLLSKLFTQLPEQYWQLVITNSVKNVTSIIKTSADLGEILAELPEKSSIEILLKNILDKQFISSLIKTAFDIFEILYILPQADRWKLDLVLSTCNVNFPIDVSEKKNIEILKQLIYKTNLNAYQLACLAAKLGYASVLKVLAEQNLLMHTVIDDEGLTLAHIAAKYNHPHIIKILAELNCNLNQTVGFSWAPIHIAAQAGNVSVIRELAKNKHVDLNIANKAGTNATHIAAKRGNALLMQTLAELGANLTNTTNTGLSPAHMAVDNNKENVIKILLQHHVSFFEANQLRNSPFAIAIEKKRWHIVSLILHLDTGTAEEEKLLVHKAVEKNDLEAVKILAQHHFNLQQQNKNGDTPAHLAARNGNADMLNLLAQYHVNLNQENYYRLTPLHLAVEQDAIAAIRVLGEKGANLNYLDNNKLTAAFKAAKENKIEIIKVLAEFDVDFFTIKNSEGETPFNVAFNNNNWDIVVFLMKKNPQLCATELNRLAHLLIEKGSPTLIEKFIENNISLTYIDENGDTLAHLAACMGRYDLLTPLANSNVSLSQVNKSGNTALHFAAEKNHSSVIKILAECNVDLNVKNHMGLAPAHLAALFGNKEAMSTLAEYKADLSQPNNDGESPIQVVIRKGFREIRLALVAEAMRHYDLTLIESLLQAKVNFARFEHDGNNLSHMSAQNNMPAVLALLAKYGMDLDQQNRQGETPAYIAAAEGHIAVIEELCKHHIDFIKCCPNGQSPLAVALENEHWEILVILLLSIEDVNSLDPSEKALLVYNSDDLTQAFISLCKTQSEAERENNIYKVLHGQNALGSVLHTTNNPFQFFAQKFFNTQTKNIQLISMEFDKSKQEQNDEANSMSLS